MARASPTASSRRASGVRSAALARVARVKIGADDQARAWPRRRRVPRIDCAALRRGSRSMASASSSTASNMVIGLAGMMVEIACL